MTTRGNQLPRRAPTEIQSQSTLPSTPSPLPQQTSTSTTRLRKRSSLIRPLSSANRLSGGDVALLSTPSRKTNDESTWTDLSSKRNSKRSSSPGSFPSEFKGAGTARSSWLRRMSTLSSLKAGSPVSTPRPESPSQSFSNGSIAPILPSTSEYGAGSLSRNKLVKRCSSQRALQGDIPLSSTLRRPATSHQRTATVRQQDSPSEELYPKKFIPTAQFDDLQEDHQAFDDSLQTWLPFFTNSDRAPTEEGFSRKRNDNTGTNRREPLGRMVPNVNGLPTLLLATSISSSSSDNSPPPNVPRRSNLARPSTAVGFESFISSFPEMHLADVRDNTNLKSRHSFSLTDMFSYSSPTSWKTPRNGNSRKSKGASAVISKRRISSAPHQPNMKQDPGSKNMEADKSNTPNKRPLAAYGRERPFEPASGSIDTTQRASSSHLPPLNRLSSFEIDLPATTPSYPKNPREGKLDSSPVASSPPSPSVSPPLNFAATRNQYHRPSGALSDRTSTLLGSDQENSRFLSGDEDDLDYRSDTIYDSTRTRTTRSSHSGVRKLPIQAMFDESPPEKFPKHKLMALEDLLSNESFVEPHAYERRVTEDRQSFSTKAQATLSCKEDNYPASTHAADKSLPTDLPSSPLLMSEAQANSGLEQDIVSFQDDPDWSLSTMEHKRKESWDESATADDANTSPSYNLPGNGPASHTLTHDIAFLASDSTSNPDFEWSEKRITTESPQRSSPRPKTEQGTANNDNNRSRLSGRRGSNALHLRSQSVPVPQDTSGHRSHNTLKLFGTKGASEEWDGDFDFEEPSPRPIKHTSTGSEAIRANNSSRMLVPRAIMERQASVYGQFGQVKELTLLVDQLKELQQQANIQGIMQGQSIELWKEAEGIINLATLDNEEEFFPPRSPPTNGFESDLFDEDSPSHGRRKSGFPSPKEDKPTNAENASVNVSSSRTSLEKSLLGTPPSSKSRRESILSTPPMSRPRKESAAQAKSVLETIHQQRSQYNTNFLDAKSLQKKLPFDTTSLRDLVTRAGVVTRALKEIVRRAENPLSTSNPQPLTSPDPPPDPLFSQIFHQPPSPSINKSPRVTQSPKSGSFRGGSITGNDNEINGHMKMMTVV